MRGKCLTIAAAVLWASVFHVASARAQATINLGASVLFFPKVIADGTRDTVIQIANTSNALRHAQCVYTAAQLVDVFTGDPCLTPSSSCLPLWLQRDFRIRLTRQQPTYWVVSQGRPLDPGDNASGYDPGQIPPATAGFQGELICFEVDASGSPLSGNALIGEATVTTLDGGDSSKYNAVGLRGFDTNNGDSVLCLGGAVDGECPNGAEYDACPAKSSFGLVAQNAEDPVLNTATVRTTVTIVPCAHNFELQLPASVTLGWTVTNEFESRLSGTASVQCWSDLPLSALGTSFSFAVLGTTYAQATFAPQPGSGSVAMVVDERHEILSDPTQFGSAAINVHVEGQDEVGDRIVLPGH